MDDRAHQHLDAVVGHNHDSLANPTQFVFLNIHGHIDIVEIPAGDPSQMRVYVGPVLYSNNADLVPATGRFATSIMIKKWILSFIFKISNYLS